MHSMHTSMGKHIRIINTCFVRKVSKEQGINFYCEIQDRIKIINRHYKN